MIAKRDCCKRPVSRGAGTQQIHFVSGRQLEVHADRHARVLPFGHPAFHPDRHVANARRARRVGVSLGLPEPTGRRGIGKEVNVGGNSSQHFFATSVTYIGIVVTPEGISMEEDKISAIRDWLTPKTVKQVQAFLGFMNLYR